MKDVRSAPGKDARVPAEWPGAMVARPWKGFWASLLSRDGGPGEARAVETGPLQPWQRAARLRRRGLLAAVLLATVLATWILARTQPLQGNGVLHAVQIGLFALLFAWVTAGCLTALMGFVVLLRGDRHAISREDAGHDSLSPDARTALIMPICHEDVATVFAGLRATMESVAVAGGLRVFDLFILSDSTRPEVIEAEKQAHDALCRRFAGRARIHWRVRTQRGQKKAGNVAEFCRRWGRRYRYMVVLDADSVMSGDCLLTLVRLMERHPEAGILQTAPKPCGIDTLHARAQQFVSRVVGPLFTAGMQYWQLGEAHYWGHNAIIRVEPFMQHCALAPLKGEGALAGDILSHDFVEAALMRRAGYQVWMVSDLQGSFEQPPPHLLAELQRDRRWCQGNLQNARLIAEPGLHGVHRAMLFTGALSYLSAPLWLGYIALGVGLWLSGEAKFDPRSFSTGALALWAGTLLMLFLPRVLGVVAVVLRGNTAHYGGALRLALSAVLEAGLSALQAPLRMVAHSVFVVGALTGWKLEWKSPPRSADVVAWRDAARSFGAGAVAALGIGAALLAVNAEALPWLLPVGLPLLLAVPLAVWTSRSDFGSRLREAGWFVVPEEAWTPSLLRKAWAYAKAATA